MRSTSCLSPFSNLLLVPRLLTLAALGSMLVAAVLGCSAPSGSSSSVTAQAGEDSPSQSSLENQCAAGQLLCGTTCVDTATNSAHCGACNNACPPGTTCISGTCVGGVGGSASTAGSGPSPTGGSTQVAAGDSTQTASGGSTQTAAGSSGQSATGNTGGQSTTQLDLFSFFVTSLEAMQRLSGSQNGFGGDLTYGQANGLAGADKICAEIAEYSMPGASQKQWRAFLSTTSGGPDGGPVHAIDRIGEGPWYDRLGRLVAQTKADLLNTRPASADPAIINDLPNEYGVPNHNPDGTGEVDNHDILTGTGPQGQLYSTDPRYTCQDWTSKVGSDGTPHCGHSWPTAMGGGPMGGGRGGRLSSGDGMAHWISALDEAGCAPGVNLVQTGGPNPSNPTVGSGGGYGGIYCFALSP